MILPLLAIIAFQWEAAYATPGATLVQPLDGLITPGPKLEVRQILTYGDPRFIGWQTDAGDIVQRTCQVGLTYSVRGTNFACCPTSTTTCSFAYECNGLDTEVYLEGTSSPCATACVTGRLYWSTADTRPYTYVGCGATDYWVVQSIDPSGLLSWNPGVASAAPKTTTASSSAASSAVVVPTAPTAPPRSSPTTTPPIGSPASTTGSPTPEPVPASKPNNSAIIGGAVGGGAVGIGLIVLGVLLFLRRKRNNAPLPVAPVMAHPQQFQNQPPPLNMRPMSYGPSGSPPPPFSPGYNQNQNLGFLPTGKSGEQAYQYAPVPNKNAPVANIQPYPQASEVSGIPVGHAMELPGSPIQQNKR